MSHLYVFAFARRNGDHLAASHGHDMGFYCIAMDTGLQKISTFDMNKSWAFDKKKVKNFHFAKILLMGPST